MAIAVAAAAMKAFVKVHLRCLPGEYIEKIPQTPEEWAAGRDTGTSSLTIYSLITGQPSPRDGDGFCTPLDPDDFGRCYRLLKLFPAWREQLGKVVERCPEWGPLVDHWDELTELYEAELGSGLAPRLYKRMQELLG